MTAATLMLGVMATAMMPSALQWAPLQRRGKRAAWDRMQMGSLAVTRSRARHVPTFELTEGEVTQSQHHEEKEPALGASCHVRHTALHVHMQAAAGGK